MSHPYTALNKTAHCFFIPKFFRYAFAILLLVAKTYPALAQSGGVFSREQDFLDYLLKNELFQDRLVLLRQMEKKNLQPAQQDSLYYHFGITHHFLNRADSAQHYFALVNPLSPLQGKGRFFHAYNLLALRQPERVKEILMEQPADTLLQEYRHLNLAACALMQLNLSDFENHRQYFSYTHTALIYPQQHFDNYAAELKNLKKHSPLIAGVLSAIVPGLGKIYAGKPRQGVVALIPIALIGAQTYEAYRRGGARHGFFWFRGGIFATFYIGNIWGSSLSTKVKQREIIENVNQQVLYDLRLSLDQMF